MRITIRNGINKLIKNNIWKERENTHIYISFKGLSLTTETMINKVVSKTIQYTFFYTFSQLSICDHFNF